jgi:hypothetical protein
MEKFTPGPWKAVLNAHFWDIESEMHGLIGDACASNFVYVNGKRLPPEQADPIAAANAHLMAAAPDMYEALKMILERDQTRIEDIHSIARAVLAKARGE